MLAGLAVTARAAQIMKFHVTMNMPSRGSGPEKQNLVHQMIVSHERSHSLKDFVAALQNNDFLIVQEFYTVPSGLENKGDIAINYRHIGKVKAYSEIR